MRRDAKVIAATLLLSGVWIAGARVADALASLEAFTVREVEVRGASQLSVEEVTALMALGPDARIWGDLEEWSERIGAHPLVADAGVARRLPGTLTVSLRERRPVALVATPVLEPVDATGRLLPIDPAETHLDLPLLRAPAPPPSGARLLPRRGRGLAAEVARLAGDDVAFLRMVSEVGWSDDATLLARWTEPRVDVLFHAGTPASRLREGLVGLADAVARDPHPDPIPPVVDLRFADQVVVRRTR